MSITITCGVRDRSAHLRESLSSWLACPEVSEVVVVDWSSREPVNLPWDPRDPRVVVATAPDQQTWHHSKCHNLELCLASGDEVLRLDADHVLSPSFFSRHVLRDGDFFRYAVAPPYLENEKHLAGAVYARRCEFFRVGGYNERLASYGYEDEDLVSRLALSGLRPRDLDPVYIRHIPHDDALRLAGQDVPDDRALRPSGVSWAWRPGKTVDMMAERNRLLCEESPWSARDKTTTWRVLATGPRTYVCREVVS